MAFDRTQDFGSSTTDVNAWGWYKERDQIIGGSGNDTLAGGEGDDEIHGGEGDDSIIDYTSGFPNHIAPLLPSSSGLRDVFEGETRPPDNTFVTYYSGGNDRYFGEGGNDLIMAYEGNDLVDGGSGDDFLSGGKGNDTVIGGSGDDVMFGNSGNDRLLGGSGADFMIGGTGADFLQGGLGGDTIDGGDLAADHFDHVVAQGLMTRAAADAALRAANEGDTANYDNSIFAVNVDLERAFQAGGDARGDQLTGIENVDGSRADDILRGDNNANVLFGNLGSDTLEGRGGADRLDGGTGSDTATYESSFRGVDVDLVRATQIGGDAQGDTLVSIENVTGTRLADTLRGDEAAAGNRLDGAEGNDTLDGRGGNDVLDGGLGNDTLIGGTGFDTVELSAWDTPPPGGGVVFMASQVTVRLGQNGAEGSATRAMFNTQTFSFDVIETDTLNGIEAANGTNNADTFFGNEQDNTFNGFAGNDSFRADNGRDTYNGGLGIDTVDYSTSSALVGTVVSIDSNVRGRGGFAEGDLLSGIENVIGSAGNDIITGNTADNRFTGGRGNDTLIGGDGNDTLIGDGDNDVLNGGLGNDTLLGGSGTDTADFSAWDNLTGFSDQTIRLGLNGADGTATRESFRGLPIPGFVTEETDTLSSIEQVIGSNRVETMFGNELDNVFDGRGGNDTFFTDFGRDTYAGGSGVDTVNYSASSAAAGITVSIDSGTRGTGGFADGDLLFGIENVRGSGGNDNITGNGADNNLSGGGGDDNLFGGDGADTLIGGQQVDIDRLSGGAGRDTFLYLSRDDSRTVAGRTGDGIQDFHIGEDVIDLRQLNVDANDMLFESLEGGAVVRLTEDINGNAAVDVGEFSLLVRIEGGGELSLTDVLM